MTPFTHYSANVPRACVAKPSGFSICPASTPRRKLLLSALLGGLGASMPAWSTPTRPLQVVATFSILADMAQQLAGDAAVVSSLVGPNSDAHVFEPTAASIKQVASADLLIVNGLGFEFWLDRLLRASAFKGKLVLASEGITPRKIKGSIDPHAWHSLTHAMVYVSNIQQSLMSQVPAQGLQIEERAKNYTHALRKLDQDARQMLSAIAPDKRRAITSHDAFGYLGDAYGITLLSPRNWRGHAEASAGDVAQLIRQIRTHQVRAVFLENISDAKLIQQIARESGARVGGTLYSDALSTPDGPAATYLQLMQHNLHTFAAALNS
ncbi:MAG: metal ABC transporter solute-binding protein, Zn/Mn family [Burkholderiales bacterium]